MLCQVFTFTLKCVLYTFLFAEQSWNGKCEKSSDCLLSFDYLISKRSDSSDVTIWPMKEGNIMSSDSGQPITGRIRVHALDLRQWGSSGLDNRQADDCLTKLRTLIFKTMYYIIIWGGGFERNWPKKIHNGSENSENHKKWQSGLKTWQKSPDLEPNFDRL